MDNAFSECYLDTFNRIFFTWDRQFKSQNMTLSEDSLHVTCEQEGSVSQFKSVLGSERLRPGDRYFFEVKLTHGSNFKIGIATRKSDLEMAFSDKEHGWAYYSSGFLRHNSGGDGPSYGQSYGTGSTIGVYVDLIDGKMFFSKDSKVFPAAYESKEFLKLELYPACSCFLVGEKFELLMPVPED